MQLAKYPKILELCKDIPMLYASTSCVNEWWRSPYGTTKKVMEEVAYDLTEILSLICL